MTPDARELHRVITASVRELLETVRLADKAPPVMPDAEMIRIVMSAMGRRGGRVGGRAKSAAKTKASRANGRLGGRPKGSGKGKKKARA